MSILVAIVALAGLRASMLACRARPLKGYRAMGLTFKVIVVRIPTTVCTSSLGCDMLARNVLESEQRLFRLNIHLAPFQPTVSASTRMRLGPNSRRLYRYPESLCQAYIEAIPPKKASASHRELFLDRVCSGRIDEEGARRRRTWIGLLRERYSESLCDRLMRRRR